MKLSLFLLTATFVNMNAHAQYLPRIADHRARHIVQESFSGRAVVRPPEGTDAANIVSVGRSDSYAIIGVGSSDAIAEALRPHGLTPKSYMGLSMVVLNLSLNDDFVGCGCPKAFKEFQVLYTVNEGTDGSLQSVPIYSITDHPVRRHSMATKFGTKEEMGYPDIVGNTMVVRDPEGRQLLSASPNGGFPQVRYSVPTDLGLHSIGGIFEGLSLAHVFYRLSAPTMAGFRPYVAQHDNLEVTSGCELSALLHNIHFRPLFWESAQLRDGYAWIPSNQ